MRFVYQTILEHAPRDGRFGNCMQAALATVLGLSLNDVPHFGEGTSDDQAGTDLFNQRVSDYLAARGQREFWITIKPDAAPEWMAWLEKGPRVLHLIGGQSIRGHPHVVVGLNGRPIHDPHPDGGPLEPDADGTFKFMFLISSSEDVLALEPQP